MDVIEKLTAVINKDVGSGFVELSLQAKICFCCVGVLRPFDTF